jgi:hypothetical protein
MTLNQFKKTIEFYSNQGFSLSMKEVSEMKNKFLKKKLDWKKADIILKKNGYEKLTWKEWKKRI